MKVKMKVKKIDKFLDLVRNLKKLWNVRVVVIPVVVGALRTVPKSLQRGLKQLEIRGTAKTILTTELLRLVRILRSVQRKLVVTHTLLKDLQLILA